MKLSTKELLTYSTVRIQSIDNNGQVSVGTGFIINIDSNKDSVDTKPLLITNKHVIENGIKFTILFCTADQNNNPLDNIHFPIDFTTSQLNWIMHPDSDVDLCAIPIAPFVKLAEKFDKNLFYSTIGNEWIPSDEALSEFDAIENITMIGYPIGLWDHTNNKPLHRTGITATHVAKDYCGKKEFLIDCACFPGSSGSPIFLLDQGHYFDPRKDAIINGMSRFFLLGILYAGPQYNAIGDITVVNVPTGKIPKASTNIPMNLGFAIKSERIKDFLQFMPRLKNN